MIESNLIYIDVNGSVDGSGWIPDTKDNVKVEVRYDDGTRQSVVFDKNLTALLFSQVMTKLNGDDRRMAKILF